VSTAADDDLPHPSGYRRFFRQEQFQKNGEFMRNKTVLLVFITGKREKTTSSISTASGEGKSHFSAKSDVNYSGMDVYSMKPHDIHGKLITLCIQEVQWGNILFLRVADMRT
jgi:hypothetical protein